MQPDQHQLDRRAALGRCQSADQPGHGADQERCHGNDDPPNQGRDPQRAAQRPRQPARRLAARAEPDRHQTTPPTRSGSRGHRKIQCSQLR